jgi:hypothetical protein
MATSASGRHSPPWGKLEGCTAGHESFDVYTRSARRRGGWWVRMCGPHSLTRDGHHGTAAALGRRTPRARGTRATYTTTRAVSARYMLFCGHAPPPPPALAAHRPSPPTNALSPRRRSVPPPTLRHHRRIHLAGHTCHRRCCTRVGTAFGTLFHYRPPLARTPVAQRRCDRHHHHHLPSVDPPTPQPPPLPPNTTP